VVPAYHQTLLSYLPREPTKIRVIINNQIKIKKRELKKAKRIPIKISRIISKWIRS
jgi:hypothetical protein